MTRNILLGAFGSCMRRIARNENAFFIIVVVAWINVRPKSRCEQCRNHLACRRRYFICYRTMWGHFAAIYCSLLRLCSASHSCSLWCQVLPKNRKSIPTRKSRHEIPREIFPPNFMIQECCVIMTLLTARVIDGWPGDQALRLLLRTVADRIPINFSIAYIPTLKILPWRYCDLLIARAGPAGLMAAC